MGHMPEAFIEIQGVTKTYKVGDETVRAMDNISCQIKEGEFVAIIGPSGSGKSTLANIIGGLDAPDAGTVRVAGEDLSKMNDKRLSEYRNRQIGFVFQSFNLQASYTALENVMLPLVLAKQSSSVRSARAAECLRLVGLADRMHHLPAQLSGGQRQRVAIARALASGPKIIVADEPTGNLDSSRGQEIMALLKELNGNGITLLVVTHDLVLARQASRIMEIRDGRLTEHSR
jgi:putative ABC transport system ATP-binding protein